MKSNLIHAVLTAYLVAMFVFLPLYVHNGYYDIGTAKFTVFRTITIAMLVAFAWAYAFFVRTKRKSLCFSHERERIRLDSIDYALFAFCGSQIMSYVFSVDRSVSAWGIDGWYMGVVPYLLMADAAFIYRHFYVRTAWTPMLMLVGMAIPAAFAIPNALGIGVFLPRMAGRLSTIGNSNWFAGYDSVLVALAFAFVVAGSMRRGRNRSSRCERLQYLAMIACLIIAVASALVCGTDSILLSVGVLLIFCILIALSDSTYRYGAIVSLISAAIASTWALGSYVIDSDAMPLSDLASRLVDAAGGRILMVVFAALLLLATLGVRSRRVLPFVRRWLPAVIVASCVVILAIQMSGVLPDSFGTGRGTLWSVGAAVFRRGSLRAKLIGNGQDTFSTVLASGSDLQSIGGFWDWGVRATNCHSWILTELCDCGILGVCTVLNLIGVSLKSLCTRSDAWSIAGVFAIVSVLANLSVSFSQVMVTPYLFLIVGIALSEDEAVSYEKENA